MSQVPTVRFPAFRRHTQVRHQATNSMLGLLAVARVANRLIRFAEEHGLAMPVEFPWPPDGNRLTSHEVLEVLVHAESHLGMMAVPYALAIHEDLLRSCLELTCGPVPRSTAHLHGELAFRAGGAFDADAVARFHVLREMRNAVIHAGGIIDERLVRCASALSPSAAEEWKRIAGRSPLRLRPGARVDFGLGELWVTLDTTKELADQANWMLIPALGPIRWAQIIVDDFMSNGPANIMTARRPMAKLLGFAQFHYHATGVGEAELRIAATDRQLFI